VLRQMLKEVNDMAKGMIHEAAQNLVTLGKNIKMALDDYTRQVHELIINWKEIEANSDKPLKDVLVTIYKKIYYIVKLMQIFFKEE
jgi:gas vesicle protein